MHILSVQKFIRHRRSDLKCMKIRYLDYDKGRNNDEIRPNSALDVGQVDGRDGVIKRDSKSYCARETR